MKIAYLGKIQLSDIDLSYLNAAQKLSDITYFIEITPRFTKGPAFNINKIYPHSGIFKAIDAYPEFRKYEEQIDLNKFYVVNTFGKFWQIKAFWTNFLLLLFLIKNNFNVIHLTWPANIYEFIIYILRKHMILTVHDPFPHTGLDTSIVRLRRKVAFNLVPKLMILNKAQQKDFLTYYNLSPNRVVVSRLSCYNNLKYVIPNIQLLPKEKYILFAGKISKYKGIDFLLPAMKKVHESHPNIKLVIAGGGMFHFDISPYEKYEYIDIRNRFIPDEELVALIKNALFMVCPYTDATQSGVIMSAFAFNIPVIASAVGGLPEMLQNGKFGILIQEKNTDAITKAINDLISNEEKINTYRHNLASAYENKGELSWIKIAEEIKQIYKQIF